jgi:hypothetical protein
MLTMFAMEGCVTQDDGEVALEDMIAMEQVAKELWQKTTKGTDKGWQALSVLAKQCVAQPRAHGGHNLAPESRSAISAQRCG